MRRMIKALGIPFTLLATVGSNFAVVSLTAGPASAQGIAGTTCQTLGARSPRTSEAISGGVSRCDTQIVTGGGGTFAPNSTFSSATIVWNSGNTSDLTGMETFIKGGCSASLPKDVNGYSQTGVWNGTVTGGNAFVGDQFSAGLCFTFTGNAVKISLGQGDLKTPNVFVVY